MTDLADATPDRSAPPTGPTGGRSSVLRGGLWSAASQFFPAFGTAALSVAAARYLGSGPLGRQSLIAYVNSAASAIVVMSLTFAVLQVGGRLHGEQDGRRLEALVRWAVGAHLLSGAVVFAVVTLSGALVGTDRAAWLIIGVVAVLDAAADGLSIRLILVEGWAPIGQRRLVFQLLGPVLGIAFLLAGLGIAGIFLGDGVAALGLLLAVAPRYRRVAREDGWSQSSWTDGAPVQRPLHGRAWSLDRAPTSVEHDWAVSLWSVPSQPAAAAAERPGARPRTAGVDRLRPPVFMLGSYTLFAISALITQVVSKRVEFVVLAIFSTDTALGMYSVAFMAVNLLTMLPMGLAGAAMPMIAAAAGRGEIARANHHMRLALRVGTALTVPMTGLLAALGPTAIALVYGARYNEASRLVPVASLTLLFAVVTGVLSQFWSGQGRLAIVLATGGIAAVVDLSVALSLVPGLNAWGAVLANLAAQLTLAVALLYVTVQRTGGIGWRLPRLAWSLACGAAGAGAVVLVHLAMSRVPLAAEVRSALDLMLGGIVGVLVVSGVAMFGKLLDVEEEQWLAALLPRRVGGPLARISRAPVGATG